jgi:hypothetical protein
MRQNSNNQNNINNLYSLHDEIKIMLNSIIQFRFVIFVSAPETEHYERAAVLNRYETYHSTGRGYENSVLKGIFSSMKRKYPQE